MNEAQEKQLHQYPLHKKVWVLDSQWQDRASKIKTVKLAEQGHTVFIWPEKYGKRFKDFNDIVVHLGIDEIQENFIQKNVYTGLAAQIIFSKIKIRPVPSN